MAKFLKPLLEKEGISQAELSRLSGVSANTINKICQQKLGAAKISATTKGKLLKAINTTVDAPGYQLSDIKF